MLLILPTAQNIPLLLYVHHATAALVNMYPRAVSIGTATPMKLVNTSGSRQYPNTLQLRGKVRVDVLSVCSWDDMLMPGLYDGGLMEDVVSSWGLDMRLKMRCRETEPMAARP
jgi:hypothetical protein